MAAGGCNHCHAVLLHAQQKHTQQKRESNPKLTGVPKPVNCNGKKLDTQQLVLAQQHFSKILHATNIQNCAQLVDKNLCAPFSSFCVKSVRGEANP